MSDNPFDDGKHDKQLAGLFAQMRESDARIAPEPPAELTSGLAVSANETLASEGNVAVVAAPAWKAPLQWGGALAAALLIAFVAIPNQEAPEDLYLEIMSANNMITEDLVIASAGTLPELHPYDEIYGDPEPVDFAEFLN